MLYFAYGSNMSTPRLAARIASARAVTIAKLAGHALRFHKIGKDGSAKADAEKTGRAGDVVHGVVFQIDQADRPALDRFEGAGYGYEPKTVAVITPAGETLEALTYRATRIDNMLAPFDWYKDHVLRGAREHALPPEYIAMIEALASLPDSDLSRREREESPYRP